MKVEAKIIYGALRVYIGDTLHLHITRPIHAVQTWMRRPEGKFFIEVHHAGGVLTADYDSEDKWRGVLSEIDKALLSG